MTTLKVIALSKSEKSALVSQDIAIPGTPFVTSVTGNLALDASQDTPDLGTVFSGPDGFDIDTETRVTEDGKEFVWFKIKPAVINNMSKLPA